MDAVVVPVFFSPSRWVMLEECPISVWAHKTHPPVLPESPEALFGTMLHAVRHRFLIDPDRVTPPRERIVQLADDERRGLEARLAAQGQTALVPLQQAIGGRKWADRIKRLQLWATDVERWTGPDESVLAAPEPKLTEGQSARDVFSDGPEPWWQVVALRLRGRPDEARLINGELVITDLKTGAPFISPGEFRPEVLTQLHLYALMAEALAPGTPVRLVVQHSRKDPVAWDDEARAEIRERNTRLRERFPAGVSVHAASAARAGSHCAGCRFRPVCATYLEQAPRWWVNDPDSPRPLPFDVWGTVLKITFDEYLRLEVRDAAGRTVQIEGLRHDRDWSSVLPGTSIYFFDLEATEDTYRHGRRIHPRNFHQKSPGEPWSDALSLSVFVKAPERTR